MIDYSRPMIPDEHLFELVAISQQTAEFLKTTAVGRTLSANALDSYRGAVAELEKLPIEVILDQPEKVAAIRHKMDVAKAFIGWIDGIVGAGVRAEEELRQRDMAEQTID